MARKPLFSIENLVELGVQKLAQLVFDEAERNAPLRKLASAALAGRKGPEAVAKLVDRRLSALERARSFLDWNKAKAFRGDLSATVTMISGELGDASPSMAIDRLLRFIATHEQVFPRIDDSYGSVQDVYYTSIAALGELTPRLRLEEADLLPGRIMASLGESSHGYLVDVARSVVKYLSQGVLRRWAADLAAAQQKHEAAYAKEEDWEAFSMASQYRDIRQIIADALGDLDGLIALEEKKPRHSQNTLAVAERLLKAGRAKEALDWVRREKNVQRAPSSEFVFADDLALQQALSPQRTSLEAQILEALGESGAAQSLRWVEFEKSLDPETLREYIAALPDFEDFEALDRAFAHVLSSDHIYEALAFFLAWPRIDLAAKLVVDHHGEWDGRRYYMLPRAADILQHDHLLASSILYRALLDDILARARSKAYPHAVRYLKKLDDSAIHSDAETKLVNGMEDHANYRASLQKNHARKLAFWASVKQAYSTIPGNTEQAL